MTACNDAALEMKVSTLHKEYTDALSAQGKAISEYMHQGISVPLRIFTATTYFSLCLLILTSDWSVQHEHSHYARMGSSIVSLLVSGVEVYNTLARDKTMQFLDAAEVVEEEAVSLGQNLQQLVEELKTKEILSDPEFNHCKDLINSYTSDWQRKGTIEARQQKHENPRLENTLWYALPGILYTLSYVQEHPAIVDYIRSGVPMVWAIGYAAMFFVSREILKTQKSLLTSANENWNNARSEPEHQAAQRIGLDSLGEKPFDM